uniref:SUI1 domain-containing protein n=1 Tax=Capra hircus TaxID=9925 RepID=A0A452EVN1_CAPHI
MSTIQNLHSLDPFADASKGAYLPPAGTEDYIHIRIQRRNGRGSLMIMIKKNLVKEFRKKFACNGTYGQGIQLQGDQHKNIRQVLVETGLDDQLKVHGFKCFWLTKT